MDRKDFLSSAAGLSLPFLTAGLVQGSSNAALIPPYLQPGDIIGITSPAGYITFPEIEPAVKVVKEWGFRVKIGQTIGKRDFSFGGNDLERAADLQQMLNDTEVKAILCARGGYGSVRIIDKLNWDRFRMSPKWIIGFSDVTVFHSHLDKNFGIASIHSKMCNSFPDDWSKAEPVQVDTILSIRRALTGEKMKYVLPVNQNNRLGTATGKMVGGNLKTLESLAGSVSDIDTTGKILFVEDTGEYLYSIDRMFWNLERTGKLSGLNGLVIGGFKIRPDDVGEEFGRDLVKIVMEKVGRYRYPVCFDFPVGHQRNNFAIKCGVPHKMEVQTGNVSVTEL